MTKPFRSTLSTLAFILLFTSSCSDNLEQEKRAIPVNSDWRTAQALEVQKPEIPLPDLKKIPRSDLTPDDLKDMKSSEAPILYGVGAGGITFDTTLEEAQSILGKPFAGPTEDGVAVYRSGMAIFWNIEGRRTPEQFIIYSSDYQGALSVPGLSLDLKIENQYSAYFSSDPSGRSFLTSLYNSLENVSDPQFSCVEEGLCLLIQDESENVLAFIWSKLRLIFSLDRKVLSEISLTSYLPSGPLGLPFDLIRGSYLNGLGLTSAWKEIEANLEINPPASVGSKSFHKYLNGVGLEISRSRSTRVYRNPDTHEQLTSIRFSSGYQSPFLFNGKPKTTHFLDKGEVTFQEATTDDTEESNPRLLSLRLKVPSTHHEGFLNALDLLLKREVQTTYPTSQIAQYQIGHSSARLDDRTFTHHLVWWSKESAQGRTVSYSFLEKPSILAGFETTTLSDPSDPIILNAAMQPQSLVERTFFGVGLGDKVLIDSIDLGREEATLTHAHFKSRVHWQQKSILDIFSENSLQKTAHRVSSALLGSLGITLLLVPDPEGRPEIKNHSYVVVGIKGSSFMGGLSHLCGFKDLTISPATPEKLFRKNLRETLAGHTAAVESSHALFSVIHAMAGLPTARLDPAETCTYFTHKSSTGSERDLSLTFPKWGVRISFDSHEVGSVLRYLPFSEGQ